MTFGGGLDIYYFTITWCVQEIGKLESDSLILFATYKLPMQISLYICIRVRLSWRFLKLKIYSNNTSSLYAPSRYFILNFDKKYCIYADLLFILRLTFSYICQRSYYRSADNSLKRYAKFQIC